MKLNNITLIIATIFTLLLCGQHVGAEEKSQDNNTATQESSSPQDILENKETEAVAEYDPSRLQKTAIIQVLDKITAKTSTQTLSVGKKQTVSKLTITIHKCWQSPLDKKPESKMLIEVQEQKSDKKQRIFYGWLISSSPSLSGLEHPIYDITAISCKN